MHKNLYAEVTYILLLNNSIGKKTLFQDNSRIHERRIRYSNNHNASAMEIRKIDAFGQLNDYLTILNKVASYLSTTNCKHDGAFSRSDFRVEFTKHQLNLGSVRWFNEQCFEFLKCCPTTITSAIVHLKKWAYNTFENLSPSTHSRTLTFVSRMGKRPIFLAEQKQQLRKQFRR